MEMHIFISFPLLFFIFSFGPPLSLGFGFRFWGLVYCYLRFLHCDLIQNSNNNDNESFKCVQMMSSFEVTMR